MLSIAFVPLLIKFELTRTERAFELARRLFITSSLGIYFAILIIPGRGVLEREQARWVARFLLILSALILLTAGIYIVYLLNYLKWMELFSDELLMFIARVGLVQAIIGVLALTAKGLALLIPYAKRYVARLSELSTFHKG